MQYKEFDDGIYTSLRKNLLKEKGGRFQKDFVSTLRDKKSFLEYIENKIKITEGDEAPCLNERLTESEFKESPKIIEQQLFTLLKETPPANACRVTFWAMITLRHIQAGIIEACFLAANGSSQRSGLERIDQALKQGNKMELDGIVRTVLRRMSGLPEARGNRSVYVNCSFARAWWRGYLSEEVCQNTSAKHKNVYKTLSISQDYWEKLIMLVVSRNSVLGDSKVRIALIWALSDLVNKWEYGNLFIGRNLEKITRRIGIRSAWQELGVFSIEELKQFVDMNFATPSDGSLLLSCPLAPRAIVS